VATVGTITQSEEPGAKKPYPRPFLFLVMECNRPLAAAARFDLDRVAEVTIGRGPRGYSRTFEATEAGARIALTVPDGWMSSDHGRVSRRGASWFIEDLGSRNGIRVNGKSVQERLLSDGDVLELGGTFLIFRRALMAPPELAVELTCDSTMGAAPGLATLLPGLEHAFGRLERIAASQVSIVLTGETGTGKEVVARATHLLSRRAGAFVGVNCGAIPESLVESELFGHKRGAFSGAQTDRTGFVQAADGGTLFLDEIGDMRLASQTALLRVLEEKQVVPLGSSRPIPVDLRVIAATHRSLDALAATGQFRSDLLARLTGFTLELPPLRARREDLGLMVAAILRRLDRGRADELRIAPVAVRWLLEHGWPMNARELHKAIEAALVLAEDNVIAPEHLPGGDPMRPPSTSSQGQPTPGERLSAKDRERKARLEELLAEHKGNIAAVARVMERDRNLVRRWISRYGLELSRYRDD
jgi:DNA-binding NtrC family response regulator